MRSWCIPNAILILATLGPLATSPANAAWFSKTSKAQGYDSLWSQPTTALDLSGDSVVAIPRDPKPTNSGGVANGVILTSCCYRDWPSQPKIVLSEAFVHSESQSRATLGDGDYFPTQAIKSGDWEASWMPHDTSLQTTRVGGDEVYAEVLKPGNQKLLRADAMTEAGGIGSHRMFSSHGNATTNTFIDGDIRGSTDILADALIRSTAKFIVYENVPFRLAADLGRTSNATASFSFSNSESEVLYERNLGEDRFISFQLEGVLTPGSYRIDATVQATGEYYQSGSTDEAAEFWYAFRALTPPRGSSIPFSSIPGIGLVLTVPEPVAVGFWAPCILFAVLRKPAK